jgi:hypothetical protein
MQIKTGALVIEAYRIGISVCSQDCSATALRAAQRPACPISRKALATGRPLCTKLRNRLDMFRLHKSQLARLLSRRGEDGDSER